MHRVLVAVDPSEGSRRAVAFVDRFFAGTGVELRAVNVNPDRANPVTWGRFGGVHAWPWPGAAAGAWAGLDGRSAHEDAESAAAAHAPEGTDVEVVHGDTVAAINEAAAEVGADLVVVGDNHRGLLDRLVVPSTPHALVKEAAHPVLVVP